MIENGISRDVVGRVVTKVGLTEACLQMTSFAGVPGSRTWFPEHLKDIYSKTGEKKLKSSQV